MVSDVAEGLPDGPHDSSYIYASVRLGEAAAASPALARRGQGDAAALVSGDFSTVTWPAGWTRAQLVASPVETADNGKKKWREYNEYQWRGAHTCSFTFPFWQTAARTAFNASNDSFTPGTYLKFNSVHLVVQGSRKCLVSIRWRVWSDLLREENQYSGL